MLITRYFTISNSFLGDVYVKVCECLNVPPSTVIKNKFHPDYKFLINYYSNYFYKHQKKLDELEDEL
jgi:hypothetical protein